MHPAASVFPKMSESKNPVTQEELVTHLEDFKMSLTDTFRTEIAASILSEVSASVRSGIAETVRAELASTIRTDITAAVVPLKETQKEIFTELADTKKKVSEVSTDNADTKSQVQELQNQVKTLQQRLDNPASSSTTSTHPLQSTAFYPPLLGSATTNSLPARTAPPSSGTSSAVPPSTSAVLQSAKKILGFAPITIDDINYLKAHHPITDDSEAMTFSILEFMNMEMKVPKHVTDNLVIKRVFPPARQPDGWKTLYAEFQDISTANLINQYVLNLQPGKTVSIYVPHCLFPRFSAIRDIEHSYRNGEIKHKTRIKYGTSDFVLLVKPRDKVAPWSYVSLDSLPPIQLSLIDTNSSSSSPPPGRIRLNSKRGRDSPGTDSARNNKTKLDKEHDDSVHSDDLPKDLPVTVLPLQTDLGSFHPSACVSPSIASNKSFTFSAKSTTTQQNLNF